MKRSAKNNMGHTKISSSHRMSSILLCFCLLGASALDVALASPLSPIEQTLNTVIDKTWANKTPGIQVGLWVPGQGEWTIAKGLSDLERKKPMKVGMQQPIGSITKTMTGTLILQLVEEGKLSLDDPLSKWYPSAPKGDQISIAMLLNMTSGIATYSEGYFGDNFHQTFLLKPHFVFQHELLAAHGLALPRVFDEPGSQYSYANTNTVLLGQIAEKVTGKRYSKLLRERFFQPLGMNRTFLDQRGGLKPPYAHTYEFDEQGQVTVTTNWSISWAWSAGGVASTLEDAHRWSIALGTGKGVLSPQTQALRQQHCSPPDFSPERSETTEYCLGVIIVKNAKSREPFYYWHDGSVPGAEAWLGYFPETGASLVILLNGRDDNEICNLAMKVVHGIEAALPQLFQNATP